ncbi:hypothetical protein SAMN06265222_12516 [Neorhodopirellula lusitana]|uniref:Uncharacterized protein n=1 Tax=Neorhodopirellula lusitana TaxID=445327 RepID=A0ABY1QUG7_9BACT|nr:hypothetical protein [Neorhodopirellula lusitana]SMP78257.1 hypothetical protein SAMN06265222_12516 [Neorhodopirellula lusitana]
MANSEHARMMAAAVYELRLLLSDHLGSDCDSDPCLRLAAHLAYALHNEAFTMLERDETFDLDTARRRIRTAESIVGDTYADNGNFLKGE